MDTQAAKWLVLALPVKYTLLPLHQHSAPALAWICGIWPLFTCKHMPELQLRLVTKAQDLPGPNPGTTESPSIYVLSSQLFQINMTGLMLPGFG